MKFLPKNLCKNLSVIGGIGVCNLRNCLCECWQCDYKTQCGQEGFERCRQKLESFKEIPDAYVLYDNAIGSADKEIQSIMETEDSTKVVAGLLFRREKEIVHCFYEAPGDLPSAISTANSYISRDISAIGCNDVKHSEIAEKVWNLIVVKEIFSNQSSRLRNRDVLCYGNEQGEEELRRLVSDPIYYIKLLKDSLEKGSPTSLEEQNVKLVYSSKMLPVSQWCFANLHQANMWDYTLYKNFSRILKHLEDVANSGEVSPRVCYRLAYPHYAGMLHTSRFVFSKCEHIKRISQLNRDIHRIIETKYSISFDVGKNYDAFLFDLWSINKSEKICMEETIGKDIEDYRFIIRDGALFGSVLLLGFISKNYESVCLKPYEKGRVFEDFVEKELLDRQVAILKRNFETPKGEVDFVCSKKGETCLIEAKDYSPWFDSNYMGSETYDERIESINQKLARAPPRLQWVESNPSAIGLPMFQKIRGIVITRFREPHIRIPQKFQYMTIEDLDEVFGESSYRKIYETNIKFTVGKQERLRLEKELETKSERFSEFGMR